MVKKQNCVIDTDSFIVYIKSDSIYKDTVKDVETSFHTSNYELDRPLHRGKNQKVIGLMKDEVGGKILKICWIKIKSLIATLIDGGSESLQVYKYFLTLKDILLYFVPFQLEEEKYNCEQYYI